MDRKIIDLHMHVVPKIDDGATDLSMAMEILQMAYEQGVRHIFCTSHNVYEEEEIKRYQSQLVMLQMCARTRFPELTLHQGCELLCAGEYIDDILYGLEIGVFLPLGNTKYVLTELYPDVTPAEAKKIVSAMVSGGWHPILAHTERYPELFDGTTIEELISLGAKIQVNVYSLEEESKDEVKERARYLVLNQYAHFLGSDAHRSNHRPPRYDQGVKYLEENCTETYKNELCFENSNHLLLGVV